MFGLMRELEPNHVQMLYEHIACAGFFFFVCLFRSMCMYILEDDLGTQLILCSDPFLIFPEKDLGMRLVYNISNQYETHSNNLWL